MNGPSDPTNHNSSGDQPMVVYSRGHDSDSTRLFSRSAWTATTLDAPTSNTRLDAKLAWHTLARWWKWVVPSGILLAALTVTVFWLTYEPKYRSFATVQMAETEPYFVFENNNQSRQFVATQRALIRHPTILDEVLSDPNIRQVPELIDRKDPTLYLAEKIEVTEVGGELFEVAMEGDDARDTTRIINAIVDKYLTYHTSRDSDRVRKVLELLEEERRIRQKRANEIREDLSKLGSGSLGSAGSDGGRMVFNLRSERAVLSDQLTKIEVEKSIHEAKLAALEGVPIDDNDIALVSSNLDVDSDPAVQTVLGKIESIRAKMANYEMTFADGRESTEYKRLQAELAKNEEMLSKRRETRKAEISDDAIAIANDARQQQIHVLREQIETDLMVEQLVRDKYDAEVKRLEELGDDSWIIEFKRIELEREENVLDRISARSLALRTELQAPPRVRKVRDAQVPELPEDMPFAELALAAALAFLIPYGVVLLWEWNAARITDTTQLRRCQLPVVAEIAELPMSRGSGRRLLHGRRESNLFRESVDGLRTCLRLAKSMEDIQVLAISSAVSFEGKTSLAAQFAASITRSSGERVLLIDADMRSPDLHTIFDVSNDIGLADVLADQATLEDAIVPAFDDMLDLLPAGKLRVNPHRLVGKDAFGSKLDELRRTYRFIIIDTPPVLAASESLVFAAASDASLVCARQDYSRSRQVQEAYARLVRAEANPLGTVLNGVPFRHYANYYGHFGDYS